MKVTFQFMGMIAKLVNWKKKLTLELPEGATAKDAMDQVDIDWNKTKEFGFVIINGKKVKEDHVLQDGDTGKVYPKSFGG